MTLAARRVAVPGIVIGILALILTSLAGLIGNPSAFFRAYLVGYTFWLGLGLGSLGVVLVQFLTGGNWGLATRRIFEAGAATLPLMALLFVPLLFGLPQLYVWARPEAVAGDAVLQHKATYLNVPFFIGRATVYLVVWVALVFVLRRLSAAQDRKGDPLAFRPLHRSRRPTASGPGTPGDGSPAARMQRPAGEVGLTRGCCGSE